MILCNLCAKHQATIYFKGVVNDQMVKLHLCESCAKKKGMIHPIGQSILSLGDMVAALATLRKAEPPALLPSCKKCGLTYVEFKKSSQLGCSACYLAFSSFLGPLLERIHGSRQHVGKTLQRGAPEVNSLQELARLKVELRDAIQQEAYENAAALRDHIRALEEQLKGEREEA